MTKTRIRVLLLVMAGLFFPFNASAEDISIPGTGDGTAVLKSIAASFSKHTGISVDIPQSIGSSAGIKAAGMGMTPMARVARNIKDEEKHYGLAYMPVFTVPTVFFVHHGVPVDNLSEQQVLDIYSGKITDWKQVGGGEATIAVIRREDDDSCLDNLKKMFPGFKDITLTANAVTAPTTPLTVNTIRHKENSIAWGPYDVALANNLKVLKINGKHPADDDYPYFNTIGLVFKEENFSGPCRDFLEFVLSPATHEAIHHAGGTPINK